MVHHTSRAHTVRRALAATPANPTTSELDILTRFALGYISLERANELLRGQGRTMRLPADEALASA